MARMGGKIFSVDGLGKYLGVGNHAVYCWIDQTAMPVHRPGHLREFKQDKVEAYVADGGAADRNKKGSDE